MAKCHIRVLKDISKFRIIYHQLSQIGQFHEITYITILSREVNQGLQVFQVVKLPSLNVISPHDSGRYKCLILCMFPMTFGISTVEFPVRRSRVIKHFKLPIDGGNSSIFVFLRLRSLKWINKSILLATSLPDTVFLPNSRL